MIQVEFPGLLGDPPGLQDEIAELQDEFQQFQGESLWSKDRFHCSRGLCWMTLHLSGLTFQLQDEPF